MHIIALWAPWLASVTEVTDPSLVSRSNAPIVETVGLQEPPRSADRHSGWYLRASGGLVTTEDSDGPGEDVEFDEGFLLGLAIGQHSSTALGPVGLGLELEGLWTQQDADDSGVLQAVEDVTVGALLLNLTFDLSLAERLSLYAGAGAGAAWMDVGTTSDAVNDFDADDGPFLAWQARAGFQWQFSGGMAANLGYRFINIDDADVDDDLGGASFELETQQHVLEAGISFGF